MACVVAALWVVAVPSFAPVVRPLGAAVPCCGGGGLTGGGLAARGSWSPHFGVVVGKVTGGGVRDREVRTGWPLGSVEVEWLGQWGLRWVAVIFLG